MLCVSVSTQFASGCKIAKVSAVISSVTCGDITYVAFMSKLRMGSVSVLDNGLLAAGCKSLVTSLGVMPFLHAFVQLIRS